MTTGMIDDELAQEENNLNHTAKNARSFYMRWAIVPANVCMAPTSIIRYFFAMFMRVVLTGVILMLSISALTITDLMSSHHVHSFSLLSNPMFMRKALMLLAAIFQLLGPALLLSALCFSAVLTLSFVQHTRYWNRRARRLQATPTDVAPPIAVPGVWPPPPRIVD